MSTKANGKPLRFAALIRVSGERQERQGESLRTQRGQIEQSVASIGGTIPEIDRYAGQEHATPGFERQRVERLLDDAAKPRRPFDAVIVADPSRWSRDNVQNETGLDHLREHGVRFFVLGMEFDLFDPIHRHFLATQATTNKLQAALTKQKAMQNKIERAKRGIPTGGSLPFGRTFDKQTEKWGVDPDKKAMIEDIAARYLAGGSIRGLATECGMHHTRLWKTLRDLSGDKWSIRFKAKDLNIDETVWFTIPRLLPEKTIKAVRQRMKQGRSNRGKAPKGKYVLSGHIFCAGCGFRLTGTTRRSTGNREYRHNHRHNYECKFRPRPNVLADGIEDAVVFDVFNMLGSPAALERSLKAAVPEADKLLKDKARVEKDLASINGAKGRLLKLIEKRSDPQVEKRYRELQDREDMLHEKLTSVSAALANLPDAATLQRFLEEWTFPDGQKTLMVMDDEGNVYEGGNDGETFGAMDQKDTLALIEAAFGEPLFDGTPAGVYISPLSGSPRGPKDFEYAIRGRLFSRGATALRCTARTRCGRKSGRRPPETPRGPTISQ
jgi:site-specific DNA recombinase